MAKVIAIASGKGGTGKTTTAINLSIALNQLGRDVFVVDANVSTPNIGLHFGIPLLPVTLNDVLEGKKRISDAAYLHHSGIKIVPASISLRKAKEADLEKLKPVITDLLGLPLIIILDTAAGIGAEPLAAIKASDETLVVTNPELPAVTDCLKTIRLAEEHGSTVVGVVLNRVSGAGHEMTVSNIEAILDRPVIAIIPEDAAVKKSLKLKNPLMCEFPNSKAAIEFKKLAGNIIGQKYEVGLK